VLPLPHDETDSRSADAVQLLRDELAPATLDGVGDWAIGGDAAESLDESTHMSQRLPILLGFVLLLTFLTMAGAFRSLVLGGVSTLLNLASVGVAFGVLTVVFQHGFAASLLDFTSPGYVIGWIPIFVLVVLVGLCSC
jgi:RND superfamily putative drug exporter